MEHGLKTCSKPSVRRKRAGTLWMCVECKRVWVVTWVGAYDSSWKVWEYAGRLSDG